MCFLLLELPSLTRGRFITSRNLDRNVGSSAAPTVLNHLGEALVKSLIQCMIKVWLFLKCHIFLHLRSLKAPSNTTKSIPAAPKNYLQSCGPTSWAANLVAYFGFPAAHHQRSGPQAPTLTPNVGGKLTYTEPTVCMWLLFTLQIFGIDVKVRQLA